MNYWLSIIDYTMSAICLGVGIFQLISGNIWCCLTFASSLFCFGCGLHIDMNNK